MIMPVYSVRDVHIGFGSPFCEANDHAAKRGFLMAMENPGSLLQYSSADFSLFKVGLFNSETGALEPVWPVELVMDGVNAHD